MVVGSADAVEGSELVGVGRAGSTLMSSLPKVWLIADARRSGSL